MEAAIAEQQGRLTEAVRLYRLASAADPDAAGPLVGAARTLARTGHWEDALAAARRAHTLEPDNPEGVATLARLLRQTGDIDGARAVWRARVERDPGDARAWYRLGVLRGEQGDRAGAVEALDRASKLAPEDTEIWVALGGAHLARRANGPALSAFYIALAHSPPGSRLAEYVLRLALREGDLRVARRAVARARNLDERSVDTTLALVGLLVERDQSARAIALLEAIVAAQPDAWRAQVVLGALLGRAERAVEAERLLGGVPSEAGRDFVEATRLRIGLALRAGRPDDAAAVARRAAEARPDLKMLVLLEASTLGRAARHGEVLERLRGAEARWPGDPDLAYARALSLDALERTDEAVESMLAVIETHPAHAGALNFVGYTWADAGERLDEAEDLIRRALEVRPRDPSIVDSLGWVLFRKGQMVEAEKLLRRAAALAPTESEIQLHLVEVLVSTGRRQAAEGVLRRAIEATQDEADRERYRQRLLELSRVTT